MRKAKYDLDENLLKPYFQFDKIMHSMFWVAGELYDYYFELIPNASIYHSDITVWQVKNKDGETIGVWYCDPYARSGKRSGAWMSTYRSQSNFDRKILPIVSNNFNFIPGKVGEPTLISWTEALTMFHEFGHAIHGLTSNVTYPSLSGTKVVVDYVEFPSQIMESWLYAPELLSKFALHFQTGESISKELIDRINPIDPNAMKIYLMRRQEIKLQMLIEVEENIIRAEKSKDTSVYVLN